MASNKNQSYKKPTYKQKQLGHFGEKMAKNGYLFVTIRQKILFNVKKSFTRRSARSKNFSRSENTSSHGNFSHFRYWVKTAAERIVLPVK